MVKGIDTSQLRTESLCRPCRGLRFSGIRAIEWVKKLTSCSHVTPREHKAEEDPILAARVSIIRFRQRSASGCCSRRLEAPGKSAIRADFPFAVFETPPLAPTSDYSTMSGKVRCRQGPQIADRLRSWRPHTQRFSCGKPGYPLNSRKSQKLFPTPGGPMRRASRDSRMNRHVARSKICLRGIDGLNDQSNSSRTR